MLVDYGPKPADKLSQFSSLIVVNSSKAFMLCFVLYAESSEHCCALLVIFNDVNMFVFFTFGKIEMLVLLKWLQKLNTVLFAQGSLI